MHRIIKTSCTLQEVNAIYEFIKSTPFIIGYEQKELLSFVDVYKCYIDDTFAGFAMNKSIGWSNTYAEIAILGVFDEYRNRGIGKELFDVATKSILDKKQIAYTVSANSTMQRYVKDLDFKHTHVFGLPLEIQLDNFGYMLSRYRITEFLRKRIQYQKVDFKCGLLILSH